MPTIQASPASTATISAAVTARSTGWVGLATGFGARCVVMDTACRQAGAAGIRKTTQITYPDDHLFPRRPGPLRRALLSGDRFLHAVTFRRALPSGLACTGRP